MGAGGTGRPHDQDDGDKFTRPFLDIVADKVSGTLQLSTATLSSTPDDWRCQLPKSLGIASNGFAAARVVRQWPPSGGLSAPPKSPKTPSSRLPPPTRSQLGARTLECEADC